MRRALVLLPLLASCSVELTPSPGEVFQCTGGWCFTDGGPAPAPTSGGSSGGGSSTGRGTSGAASSGSGGGSSSGGGNGTTGGSTGLGSSSGTSAGSSGGTGGTCLADDTPCTAGSQCCGGLCDRSACLTCPKNDGVDVYVNPYGSDAFGTGVTLPNGGHPDPACEFHSLTAALRAARTGQRVVATGFGDLDAGVVYDSASGEVFPLSVPAGVLLTTDLELDAGASLASYAIAEDAPGVGLMVQLAPGASIEGFTVEWAAGGNPGANGLGCSAAGQVTIADCAVVGANLAGAGGGVGVDVAGSCTAALSNVSLIGFPYAGLYVDTGATASYDGGLVAGNGFYASVCQGGGIFVDGGTLSLVNVTAAGNRAAGLQAAGGSVSGSADVFSGGDAGNQSVGLGLGCFAGPGALPNFVSSATVTLGGLVVRDNSHIGVDVNGGVLNLAGPVIANNGSLGIQLLAGEVTLEGPLISGNGGAALLAPANSLGSLIVDGGTLGPDGRDGGPAEDEVDFTGTANLELDGTVVQGATADGLMLAGSGSYALVGCQVSGNASVGVSLGGGTAHLVGPVLQGNGGGGLVFSSGSATLEGPMISGNGANGIYVAKGSTGTLFVDGGSIGPDDVSGGGSDEVLLDGTGSAAFAGTVVQGSPRADGFLVQGDGGYGFTGCDVYDNARDGFHFVGGSGATVATGDFTGNSVHGNGNYQVEASGGGTFDLSGTPGCGGGQNRFYCYASGFAGVRGTGAIDTVVKVEDDSWENTIPTAPTDYEGASAPLSYCKAVACDGG